MANVKDDEFETLDFADESEYMDEAQGTSTEAIAEMIADWYGRSVNESDFGLARAIIQRLEKS